MDAARERLLGLALHDVKSPLTALLLGARLLGRDPRHAQLAGEMEEAAEELERRMHQLGDALRATEDALPTEPAQLDLAAVVEDAASAVRPRATARGQTVTVDAQPSLANADRPLLFRTLVELLHSALRSGSARIEVRGAAVRVLPIGPRGLGLAFIEASAAALGATFSADDQGATLSFPPGA